MRYLMRLAFKNLWRQKRRTILTFFAISVGLISLIMVDSLMTGLDNMSINNLKRLETGDLQVYAEGYFEEREMFPIDITFAAEPVLKALDGVGVVEGVAPRLVFSGRLNTGWEEVPATAIGIDPDRDAQVFEIGKHTEGRLPEAGSNEAALGKDLASALDLALDDFFTVVTRTRDGAFQALDFTVVGLISSPHPTVNRNMVFLPLDVVADGLGMSGQVTEVAVRIQEGSDATAAAREIEHALEAVPGVEVLTWKESAVDFLAISQSKRSFSGMFLFLVLIIASVGVINTILLGAMERTREIGMMKAMGMTEREIVLEFMFEAAGIGVLASIFGCVTGVLTNIYLVNFGMDITAYIQDIDVGYPITGVIKGAWNWPMIGVAFVFGIVICMVVSYIPAKRAAKNDPVKSLRHG